MRKRHYINEGKRSMYLYRGDILIVDNMLNYTSFRNMFQEKIIKLYLNLSAHILVAEVRNEDVMMTQFTHFT